MPAICNEFGHILQLFVTHLPDSIFSTFVSNSNPLMISIILIGALGPWQIALIVLAILLLFGGRKIPELMRGMGKGIKEFKDATREDDNDDEVKRDNTKDNK